MASRLRAAAWIAAALLCLLAALLSGLLRSALGGGPGWTQVAGAFVFALALAWLAGLTAPRRAAGGWRWSPLTPLAALAGLALLLPSVRENSVLSWLALAGLWLALLHVALAFRSGRRLRALANLGVILVLAALAGFFPVAILQWHERFSGEEAFAIVQAALLAAIFLLVLLAAILVTRNLPDAAPRWSYALPRRWPVLLIGALAVVVGVRTLHLYQASFFDPAPPSYAGISERSPFVCLPAEPASQVYDGKEVFGRLVANVAANPHKTAPDYGMLALSTGASEWAGRFRAALIEEAAAGKFTGPSNSVKYGQYEAGLRAYYLPRVSEAFPGLFSPAEDETLAAWFAAVNRRALTVEWSDWVYAAALGNRPTGLYENQENGAGLVSNLLADNLGDAGLTAANRAYLDANVRGWAARFRNTDDTLSYQPEWINNALFQALAGRPVDESRRALGFEWLLVQTPPDGSAPAYNSPGQYPLAGVAYLAAVTQRDPRYVWLAGRALDYAEQAGQFTPVQPGVSAALDLQGVSPTQGSCLIYGDSGLPNRGGPLAPDKIVLRGGWDVDDAYALVNLRFTGWHRYKGTNTVPLLAFGQPVINDEPRPANYGWLPAGRSLLRDKRLPREELSGLLIPARGLPATLAAVSGIGSAWAQDPPWHAAVEQFGQIGPWDAATTVLSDWHGWQHRRAVYVLRGGSAVVVADEANGPPDQAPALTWRLDGAGWRVGPGEDVERSAEGAVTQKIAFFAGPGLARAAPGLSEDAGGAASLTYRSNGGGSLRAVTVFLANDFVAAAVSAESSGGGARLLLEGGGQSQQLTLFAP